MYNLHASTGRHSYDSSDLVTTDGKLLDRGTAGASRAQYEPPPPLRSPLPTPLIAYERYKHNVLKTHLIVSNV